MPEKLQTILFLVRHGETDNTYYQDASRDSQRQLTDLGRKQSKVVGSFLDQFSPAIIYSSPLDRCKDTAEIISRQLTCPVDTEITNKLIETYAPSAEIHERAGDREETIFHLITKKHLGKQIIMVTHQAIIASIVAKHRGVQYHGVSCDFADIYRLVFADDLLVEATRLQPAYGI
jgi:probable phosphoglycerate mutase